jgi:hypothetical protein
MHIWVEDKLPWVHINDGRPQFKTVPEPDGANAAQECATARHCD